MTPRGNQWPRAVDTADWHKLVADPVIELGWTREQMLDQVDAFFLEDLHRAWSEWPPLRKFAAALGHKPKPPPSRNYAELIGMFPRGMIG